MTPNTSVKTELTAFVQFLYHYTKIRLITFGRNFEKVKDLIVAILIVKRGKYSQSFLNTSFFVLVSAALVGGPIIAENNPFIAGYFTSTDAGAQQVLAADIYSLPVNTTFSDKPRDAVIGYKVEGGDTLASIAKKFDVSVESIQWASSLKTTTIKPGQTIQIPPVTGVVHKVVSGDNIFSIAKKYDTDPQKIANWPFNDFADIDTFALTTGQILYVPDGVMPAERPIIRRTTAPRIAAGQPGTGNFIWPTSGTVTQYPVWYHNALDIANRSLPPVIAADTGTVTYASCIKGGYGCHIIISHSNGFETLYGHLSQIGVSVGQGVAKGAQIGVLGSTGRSTGPHLHFEIRVGGKTQNPLNYLGGR